MRTPARPPLLLTPSSCSPEATTSNTFGCRPRDCALPHFHRRLCCSFEGLNIAFQTPAMQQESVVLFQCSPLTQWNHLSTPQCGSMTVLGG